MIDSDVPLDGIVLLAVPDTGSFVQIQVVAKGQFLQPSPFQTVSVMDDDFCTNIIAAAVSFSQNRTDLFVPDIILCDKPSVMGDNDGATLVGLQTFRIKNILREPQLPPDGAIRIVVLEDTCAGQNRPVVQVAFFREVSLVQRKAVQTNHTN